MYRIYSDRSRVCVIENREDFFFNCEAVQMKLSPAMNDFSTFWCEYRLLYIPHLNVTLIIGNLQSEFPYSY